jgi:hypothetical protein
MYEDVYLRYKERGRNVERGYCVTEKKDDCIKDIGILRPNPCLQYDKQCEDPFTIPKLGPGETPLLPQEPPPPN